MTMVAPKAFAALEVLTFSDLNAHVVSAYPTALGANLDGAGFDITALDELGFNDAGAVPTSAALVRRSGNTLLWRDGTASMPLNMAKGADIASASALTLGTDGLFFDVTGTTTITSISSRAAGAVIFLQFDGALTLTHNATNLILMGATNATTAAGDVYCLVSEGSGNWREFFRRPVTGATTSNFFRGDGTFAVPAGGPWTNMGDTSTEATTTSTTAVDILTLTVTSTAVTRPLLIIAGLRKGTGAAASAAVGLKLNTTAVRSPITWSDSANAAGGGVLVVFIPAQETSYLRSGFFAFSGEGMNNSIGNFDADMPAAAITSVVIRGSVTSASITMGVDNVVVYAGEAIT